MDAPPLPESSPPPPPPAKYRRRRFPRAIKWSREWWWRQARKVVVAVIGMTVLVIGIIMMVGPGPGTIVIYISLAILGTEFLWAKRWLRYAKRRLQELTQSSSPPDPPPAKQRLKMTNLHNYVPTTKTDLLSRLAVRLGYCTLPYLALAWSWSFFYGDDRFFRGLSLWLVVLVPVVGLALDLWRLKQTRDSKSAQTRDSKNADA